MVTISVRMTERMSKAIVDIRLRPRCAIAPPISRNSICFLNLCPINDKLTSLSYVHASKYIHFSANVYVYHINNSYGDALFDL